MQNALEKIIKNQIAQIGPLPISEFMRLALLHPQYGYYTKSEPFGQRGDFITAPEISQIFGEIIGMWCAELWLKMGSPAAFTLLECGAGRGTLLRDILRTTKRIKGFHQALSLFLLEASPRLQNLQQKVADEFSITANFIKSSQSNLPNQPTIILANEWLDALPIDCYLRTDSGWNEKRITLDAEKNFSFCLLPTLRQNWLTQKFPYIKPEEILEYCNESEQALENFANHIKTHKGAMLIFDYGYVETQTKCSLQAVKNHKYHNIFSDIGQADLTALVDFSQALNIINKISADLSAEIFSQGEWLETYGIKIRADQLKKNASAKQSTEIDLALKRLTHKDEMGELFKVLMLTNA